MRFTNLAHWLLLALFAPLQVAALVNLHRFQAASRFYDVFSVVCAFSVVCFTVQIVVLRNAISLMRRNRKLPGAQREEILVRRYHFFLSEVNIERGERALLTVPGVFVQQFLVAVNIMAFRAAPSLQALLVSALHGYACFFYAKVRPYRVRKENLVNAVLSGVLACLGVLLLAGHLAGGDDVAGSLIVYIVAASLLGLLIL